MWGLSGNLGASTSWNRQGLLYLSFCQTRVKRLSGKREARQFREKQSETINVANIKGYRRRDNDPARCDTVEFDWGTNTSEEPGDVSTTAYRLVAANTRSLPSSHREFRHHILKILGSNHGPDTGHTQWRLWRLSSKPQKCWESFLKQATIASPPRTLIPIPSQMNPVHGLPLSFFNPLKTKRICFI
jgi:hypothetical protein